MERISLTTSPIFCAACDSAAICALVPCASSTAARTIPVAVASWRPISSIELDNSSAATAAVSTLPLASLEADTALSARCEVCAGTREQGGGGGAHGHRAVGHRAQVILDALAEGGDRLLDDGAALLLFLHRGAFAFGVAPFGDVLMRRHPAAARHRAVDDHDHAPAGGFDFRGGGLALLHGGGQALPVFIRIAREAAVFDAEFEQACERAARPHDLVGKLVEVHVAAIAHDQPLVGVEHAQALRHVVDRDAHAHVVDLHAAGDGNGGGKHRQQCRQAGGGGRNHKFGRGSRPGAERHDKVKEREARRKADAAGQRNQAPVARNFRCGSCSHGGARVGGHAIPLAVVLQLIACG